MKRVFLTVLAAALLAVPVVQAQKVNKTAILAKIEKSDAEIADAKKSVKAATWINRGKAFYEAASEPTKSLFVNMDAPMLKLAVGEPASKGEETIGGKAFTTWVYPYFTAYIQNDKLVAWKQTKFVMKNAAVKAMEAYNKAYEIDPKSEAKVKEGLKQLADFCSQQGNVGIDTGEYAAAAEAFVLAYEAKVSPAFNESDEQLLYYAGYLLAVDGANNPKSFKAGAEHLSRAIEKGYADEVGDIYYYLFHCYYGQKAENPEMVVKGKETLLAGIDKFPKNEKILEGLMQLYTTEKGVGDPADLVAMLDKAIAENPTNTDLWFGRGRVFFALNNYDESIASFAKVVELKPEMFEGNYYLGLFYTIKGDDENKKANEKPFVSYADAEADQKAVGAIYMQAVPWLEKALEIKPGDVDTLELLKQLCFRLRDEEGMMDKYNNYNALYKQAKGLE